MPRFFPNWLDAFCDYASYCEAPRRMYYWTGLSTIAGALRRRVWIDQAFFCWYPNLYVILVAPPGIVSKSTTAGIGMNLLRKVPGIRFGPDVVTWQALVKHFAEAAESFQFGDELRVMSALSIISSEFGNLIKPSDNEMIDLLVDLWDGRSTFSKITKGNGSDMIQNPWINVIACTTPSWIAGNFPEYMIGGGFASRCVFVYAEKKAKYVAYPGLAVPPDLEETEAKLISDLEHISQTHLGEYALTREAVEWGSKWYQAHYETYPESLEDQRYAGYIGRKQTQVHKVAMILAAAQRDEMAITKADLQKAEELVSELEGDMPRVFTLIGRTNTSLHVDRVIDFIKRRGQVEYSAAYRYVHSHFPDIREFESVIRGAVQAGYLQMTQVGTIPYLVYKERHAKDPNAPAV